MKQLVRKALSFFMIIFSVFSPAFAESSQVVKDFSFLANEIKSIFPDSLFAEFASANKVSEADKEEFLKNNPRRAIVPSQIIIEKQQNLLREKQATFDAINIRLNKLFPQLKDFIASKASNDKLIVKTLASVQNNASLLFQALKNHYDYVLTVKQPSIANRQKELDIFLTYENILKSLEQTQNTLSKESYFFQGKQDAKAILQGLLTKLLALSKELYSLFINKEAAKKNLASSADLIVQAINSAQGPAFEGSQVFKIPENDVAKTVRSNALTTWDETMQLVSYYFKQQNISDKNDLSNLTKLLALANDLLSTTKVIYNTFFANLTSATKQPLLQDAQNNQFIQKYYTIGKQSKDIEKKYSIKDTGAKSILYALALTIGATAEKLPSIFEKSYIEGLIKSLGKNIRVHLFKYSSLKELNNQIAQWDTIISKLTNYITKQDTAKALQKDTATLSKLNAELFNAIKITYNTQYAPGKYEVPSAESESTSAAHQGTVVRANTAQLFNKIAQNSKNTLDVITKTKYIDALKYSKGLLEVWAKELIAIANTFYNETQ